ncbi:hypothetical protein ACFCW7_00025 [Paenibacillus glucanolyticus]|uniref:hypothetical protein n=1 Tax=Paenibacillus glucanolyticus TaxID=59843 RepID=UPI0035DB9C1F
MSRDWKQIAQTEKKLADRLQSDMEDIEAWKEEAAIQAQLYLESEAREKKLRELLELIAYAPIFDSEKVELERRREASDKLLESLYPEEEERGPGKTNL